MPRYGKSKHPPWPPIEMEEHPWQISPESRISRNQRRRIGAAYKACVAPHIADIAALPIEPGVAADAEDASQEIARFDVEHSHRIEHYGVILLRSESAASSRIEQLDASAKSVALAEIGEGKSKAAHLVVANSNAMNAASTMADSPTAESIIEMQRILLEDSAPARTGGFRDEQVWIGGSDHWPSPDAMHVAPHHTRVGDDIDDLVAFIDRDDLSPVLAQTAIAHAQFETIHPFTDGNGRTGRALAHAILRAKGVTRSVTVPISAGLLKHTDRYFAALDVYRAGDPNPIVERFTAAAYDGMNNASVLIGDIDRIEQAWRDQVGARAGSTARNLTSLLIRRPAINTAIVVDELDVSAESARRAIERLVDASVLEQAGGGQRYRRWVAPDILDALDRFSDRSR